LIVKVLVVDIGSTTFKILATGQNGPQAGYRRASFLGREINARVRQGQSIQRHIAGSVLGPYRQRAATIRRFR
jgi:hypothetical protein